ncbi:hypothetical protein BY457_10451 [Marinilabilia salmonicolor]|jgi:hypothetical protein|nr:hypothetical protein BY457_10451 [Marinilabilia salmonicolor]
MKELFSIRYNKLIMNEVLLGFVRNEKLFLKFLEDDWGG